MTEVSWKSVVYFLFIGLLCMVMIYPSMYSSLHAESNTADLCVLSSDNIIYLTGFGPFHNFSVNPSQLIVESLNQTPIQGRTIYGRILPVDFTTAPLIIQKDIKALQPELIVCLGLDATCDAITIELLSINLQFDRSHETPIQSIQKVQQGGPFFIPTRLHAPAMFSDLKDMDIPVSYSLSAGLYVCNTVFYDTLYYLMNENDETPMGFIHLPQSEDDNTSGMNIEMMKEGIQILLKSNLSKKL